MTDAPRVAEFSEREKKLLWTVLNRSQWQPLVDEGLTTTSELGEVQEKLTKRSAASPISERPPHLSQDAVDFGALVAVAAAHCEWCEARMMCPNGCDPETGEIAPPSAAAGVSVLSQPEDAK